LIKLHKSLSKRLLAITFFASILLSSCSSSIKSESNQANLNPSDKKIKFVPASPKEMNLYRQIGISYLCLARQAKVDFPKSISIASNNFTLIVSKKHGGLIEEIGDKQLTNDQIYQGSYLQLIEGAIQLCPDEVPEEEKKKFLKAVKQINKNN
tara:strand:- start:961 stop:1419 length:459 start_codon:yes stop_codon:yes gene_type:complete